MTRRDNNSEKEQNYLCGECGMTFTDSDKLNLHYRSSHYMDWQTTRKAV